MHGYFKGKAERKKNMTTQEIKKPKSEKRYTALMLFLIFVPFIVGVILAWVSDYYAIGLSSMAFSLGILIGLRIMLKATDKWMKDIGILFKGKRGEDIIVFKKVENPETLIKEFYEKEK